MSQPGNQPDGGAAARRQDPPKDTQVDPNGQVYMSARSRARNGLKFYAVAGSLLLALLAIFVLVSLLAR